MITAPDVRSPYSTEGIPLITSTDSILSVEIVLISAPEPVLPISPFMADARSCRLALFESGEPSTRTAVPKLFIELP